MLSPPRKLGFIIATDAIGGIEISTIQLVQALGKRGVDASATAFAIGPIIEPLQQLGYVAFESLLAFEAHIRAMRSADTVLISTHRNIEHTLSLQPDARHVVTIRMVPVPHERIRLMRRGKLVYQSWDFLRDLPESALFVVTSELVERYATAIAARPMIVIPNPIDLDNASADATSGDDVAKGSLPCRFWSLARNVRWKRTSIIEDAFQLCGFSPSTAVLTRFMSDGCPPNSCPTGIKSVSWERAPWRRMMPGDVVLSASQFEAFGRDMFEGFARGCLGICLRGTPAAAIIEQTDAGIVLDSDSGVQEWKLAMKECAELSRSYRVAHGLEAARVVRQRCDPIEVARQWIGHLSTWSAQYKQNKRTQNSDEIANYH